MRTTPAARCAAPGPALPKGGLAVVLGFALLTACTSQQDEPPADVAHYEPSGEGGDGALLEGELLREAGCTYVLTEDGSRVLPIFPDVGISWDGETLVVGSHEFPAGAELSIGGGYHESSIGVVPQACSGHDASFVVHQDVAG